MKELIKYLLAKADNPDFCNWWTRVTCRFKGHPEGPIYYNVNGSEPDWRCKVCGDNLS